MQKFIRELAQKSRTVLNIMELILEHLDEDAPAIREMLLEAMVLVNKSLKLAVELSCDIKQGKDYYQIH